MLHLVQDWCGKVSGMLSKGLECTLLLQSPVCARMQHGLDHALGRGHGQHERGGAGRSAGGHPALREWDRLREPVHGARRLQLGLLGRCIPSPLSLTFPVLLLASQILLRTAV